MMMCLSMMNLLKRSLSRVQTRQFLTSTTIISRHCNLLNISLPFILRSNLLNLQRPPCILFTEAKTFCIDHKNCWNCNSHSIKNNFCEDCHSLQPLKKNWNYFEILGVEKSFQIEKADLVKIYRNLQNIFHPDKFSVKPEKELLLAVEYSSAVNKAYNILLNPVSRAEYMLEIEGQSISEGEISLEADFLMNIMEINERLAEAEDQNTVKSISDKNKQIMDGLIRDASLCFSSNDIHGAKMVVAKLKYYNNIYEKVKEFETKHGIFY